MRKLSHKLICSVLVLGICIFFALGSLLVITAMKPGAVPSRAGVGDLFQDDFGNSAIEPTWTVVPKTGSITEPAGGYLRLYSPKSDWWDGSVVCTAPHANIDMPIVDFVLVTRNLNATAMTNYTHAGLMLYLDEDNVVFFGSLRDPGLGDGIAIEGIDGSTGWRGTKAGNYQYQYLRVRKESSTYSFEYSEDGNSWSLLTTRTSLGFTPAKVGLFMKNWVGQAYAALFDYFYVSTPSSDDGLLGNNFAVIVIPIVVAIIIVSIVWVAVSQKRKNNLTRSPITSLIHPQGQVSAPIISYNPKSSANEPPIPPKPLIQGESIKPGVNTRFCSMCGTQLEPAQRFCHMCGLDTKAIR